MNRWSTLLLDPEAAMGLLAAAVFLFCARHGSYSARDVPPGPDGQPAGEGSKTYTFDLQELKAPFVQAVTGAGWRWQPVMWTAPKPLRWLTE